MKKLRQRNAERCFGKRSSPEVKQRNGKGLLHMHHIAPEAYSELLINTTVDDDNWRILFGKLNLIRNPVVVDVFLFARFGVL